MGNLSACCALQQSWSSSKSLQVEYILNCQGLKGRLRPLVRYEKCGDRLHAGWTWNCFLISRQLNMWTLVVFGLVLLQFLSLVVMLQWLLFKKQSVCWSSELLRRMWEGWHRHVMPVQCIWNHKLHHTIGRLRGSCSVTLAFCCWAHIRRFGFWQRCSHFDNTKMQPVCLLRCRCTLKRPS